MSDIELKPCPKCGSTSVKYFEYDDGYSVFCRRCQFELYPHKLEKVAAEEWNAMPRPLQWTSETPTEPGWYWHRDEGILSIAYIFGDTQDNLLCHFAGEENPTPLILITGEWAGPIHEPQEQP